MMGIVMMDGRELKVNEANGCYSWTDETLQYTMTHKDKFTWYLIREVA